MLKISFFAYFILFCAYLCLSIGGFVFIKNRKSATNIGFLLFAISIFIWLSSYSIAYRETNPALVEMWFKIGYIGVIFLAITAYHFTSGVIKRFDTEKNKIILSCIVGLVFVFLLFRTNLFCDGYYIYNWGHYPKSGILHPLYLIFVFSVVSRFLYLLVAHLLSLRKIRFILEYQRTKYILVSSIIFSIVAIDFIQNYGINVFPVGFIFVILYLIVVAYAIVRYRLMDISVVITRTGIFVAVYSLVLGLPFFLAFGWQQNLITLLGANWWIIPLFTSTVLATVGPFIYLYIQKRAEARLFQEQVRYQTTLRQASLGMGRIKDLKRLVTLIVHIVTRTVRLEHSMIYLNDPKSKGLVLGAVRARKVRFNPPEFIENNSSIVQELTNNKLPIVYDEIQQRTQDYGDHRLAKLEKDLRELEAALVVPSFIDEKLMGIIILGKKISGRMYTNDDLAVFSILANQAALAIENAQFYDEMKMTHEQLFKAEKMATIGTMADGLSHQINNRLHALGFIAGDALDTVRMKKDVAMPPEIQEVMVDIEHALVRIQENVTQGGEIVQGLLKYTRKGEEGFAAVELDRLIDAAVEMTQFKIKPGEMRISREFKAGLPPIKGNFTQLQEVFFNLVDNAYDAMMQKKHELKEPGFEPTVRVFAENRKPGILEIIVEDNGIGVKDDDKEKLFTPFFTTKLSSKKGTGLGLYVIRKLIEENHEGKVSYVSRYMQGTRVYITLPTADSGT